MPRFASPPASGASGAAAAGRIQGDLKRRVVVLDLLSVVPFYDERLVAALRRIDPSVRLVAASPHRDPGSSPIGESLPGG